MVHPTQFHHVLEILMECPHPHKKKFHSWREAQNMLHSMWRTARGKKLPTRVYKCQCNSWHMTSQPHKPAQDIDEKYDDYVFTKGKRWFAEIDGLVSSESFSTREQAIAHIKRHEQFMKRIRGVG